LKGTWIMGRLDFCSNQCPTLIPAVHGGIVEIDEQGKVIRAASTAASGRSVDGLQSVAVAGYRSGAGHQLLHAG